MAKPHRAVGYSAKSREYSLAIGAAPMTSDVLADCSDSAGHLELSLPGLLWGNHPTNWVPSYQKSGPGGATVRYHTVIPVLPLRPRSFER